jgi:hypothetical protein
VKRDVHTAVDALQHCVDSQEDVKVQGEMLV